MNNPLFDLPKRRFLIREDKIEEIKFEPVLTEELNELANQLSQIKIQPRKPRFKPVLKESKRMPQIYRKPKIRVKKPKFKVCESDLLNVDAFLAAFKQKLAPEPEIDSETPKFPETLQKSISTKASEGSIEFSAHLKSKSLTKDLF